jgi:hypothetical protein
MKSCDVFSNATQNDTLRLIACISMNWKVLEWYNRGEEEKSKEEKSFNF